ncbi:MAG TPA: sigma-70 family RNA polymerase sigma factor [Gemmatimonadales bacterium]|nr:sigma-70 family RNA polymerase sigma factor [Gemmatimonadales bacterium]
MSATPTPDPPTDAALAAAYRQGHQPAATELVRRHAGALGRFLYASGAAAADVDDLVQEAFFRAFRSLASWRAEGSIRSWLFTIGGNLLRDEFRKAKGRRMLPLGDRDLADHADPQGDLVASEAEQRLREGLARLPRLQREVFLRRVQQGSAYEEIAAALGTTPGAARVHYHHAVKRLKELIG